MILRTIEQLPARRRGWRWCRRRSASGSPAKPGTPPTACRRCSPSWRATSRSCGRSRARSSTRSPTSTPCSSASPAAAPRPSPACARSSSRASPTAARRSPARSRWRRRPRPRAAALEAMGLPADARAETLARRLARLTEQEAASMSAMQGVVAWRARQGQPVAVRRRAARGRPAPARVGRAGGVAGRRADPRGPATRDEVVCPGVEGENLAARALARSARRGLGRPAAAPDDRQARPGRGGMGGGSADAAAALRLAAHAAGGADRRAAARARGAARRRRPEPARTRPGADDRRGEHVDRLPTPSRSAS